MLPRRERCTVVTCHFDTLLVYLGLNYTSLYYAINKVSTVACHIIAILCPSDKSTFFFLHSLPYVDRIALAAFKYGESQAQKY